MFALFMLFASQIVIDEGFVLIERFDLQFYNRCLFLGIIGIFIICEIITWNYRKVTCCQYCKYHLKNDSIEEKEQNIILICYFYCIFVPWHFIENYIFYYCFYALFKCCCHCQCCLKYCKFCDCCDLICLVFFFSAFLFCFGFFVVFWGFVLYSICVAFVGWVWKLWKRRLGVCVCVCVCMGGEGNRAHV